MRRRQSALRNFLHRLELAEAATGTFLQSAAKGLENANGIDAAQLVQAGAVRKALFAGKAGASIG